MKYVMLMLLTLVTVGCGDSKTFSTSDSAIASEQYGIELGLSSDGTPRNDNHFYSDSRADRAKTRHPLQRMLADSYQGADVDT